MTRPSFVTDVLTQAAEVALHLKQAAGSAPHTSPPGPGRLHADDIVAAQRANFALVNLVGESKSIADEYDPDNPENMLAELIAAVRAKGGRLSDATATRAGTDAAIRVIREELCVTLAPQPGDEDALTERLRRAVKVQDPVIRLELYTGGRADKIAEAIDDYPVPRIPIKDDELMLEDRRLARVVGVRLVGRAAVVLAKVWGNQPAPTANDDEDTF